MKKGKVYFKRNLFTGCLSLVIALSIATATYAATKTGNYTYSNGYKMNYSLYNATAGIGGYTNTENDAIAFVGLFSYKNGTVKNSGTAQQDCYVSLAITTSGGNSYVSHHSLKYSNNVPIGSSVTLELP